MFGCEFWKRFFFFLLTIYIYIYFFSVCSICDMVGINPPNVPEL